MKSRKSDKRERQNRSSTTFATERDPLLLSSPSPPGYSGTEDSTRIRAPIHSYSYNTSYINKVGRRNINTNPRVNTSGRSMNNRVDGVGPQRTAPSFAELPTSTSEDPHPDTPYEIYKDSSVGRSRDRSIYSNSNGGQSPTNSLGNSNREINRPLGSLRYLRSNRDRDNSISQSRVQNSNSLQSRKGGDGDRLQQYYNERANRIFSDVNASNDEPLVEVNQEIMAVRKSALTAYEPLTYTWLICSPGFSITAALAMSNWTAILDVSYWFMLLPCWLSHASLMASHIYAVKALSTFIHQANVNRQRQDSTDHIDRTEYLPLLQRALKFGIKTGAISIALFIFELLMYFRLSYGRISLALAFTPMWIITFGGILDGIVCKTQHAVRVFSWILLFFFMTLLVLKVDYGMYTLAWKLVFAPLLALMGIAACALVYILHGNHIGYFRLTESQRTGGMLYSSSMITGLCLTIMLIIQDLARPNSYHIRVLMVALAPLSVALMSLGAYAVSRDEFERLLQLGGQAAIHPKKLRLERNGWTAVESKGVASIPMFGEVRYEPLDPKMKDKMINWCMCCTCYPYEEEEESSYIPERRMMAYT